MLLPVEFGIMRKPVLDGPADDGIAIDDAVGLGYDAAVDAARFMVG